MLEELLADVRPGHTLAGSVTPAIRWKLWLPCWVWLRVGAHKNFERNGIDGTSCVQPRLNTEAVLSDAPLSSRPWMLDGNPRRKKDQEADRPAPMLDPSVSRRIT